MPTGEAQCAALRLPGAAAVPRARRQQCRNHAARRRRCRRRDARRHVPGERHSSRNRLLTSAKRRCYLTALLRRTPTPMSLLPFCEWLASTPGSIALHESLFMYPLVESVHVLTLCLFVGMTMMLDLRLTGRRPAPRAGRRRRHPPAADDARRFRRSWSSAACCSFTRFRSALTRTSFSGRSAIFLVLAGLNAFAFHTGHLPVRVERGAATLEPPTRARFAGIASLVLWAVVIVTGRMIAYNWFDCDKPQPRWVQLATGCSLRRAAIGTAR